MRFPQFVRPFTMRVTRLVRLPDRSLKPRAPLLQGETILFLDLWLDISATEGKPFDYTAAHNRISRFLRLCESPRQIR
jgi:hypothetical protein